jgi:hypothetical protein
MIERETATGRRRYRNRQEADELAREFEASGLTQREFCERNDVSLNVLARYLKRYRQATAPRDGQPQWVAVEVAERNGGGGLSVVLGGGRRIEVRRGFDRVTLQQLVAALEKL